MGASSTHMPLEYYYKMLFWSLLIHSGSPYKKQNSLALSIPTSLVPSYAAMMLVVKGNSCDQVLHEMTCIPSHWPTCSSSVHLDVNSLLRNGLWSISQLWEEVPGVPRWWRLCFVQSHWFCIPCMRFGAASLQALGLICPYSPLLTDKQSNNNHQDAFIVWNPSTRPVRC